VSIAPDTKKADALQYHDDGKFLIFYKVTL